MIIMISLGERVHSVCQLSLKIYNLLAGMNAIYLVQYIRLPIAVYH